MNNQEYWAMRIEQSNQYIFSQSTKQLEKQLAKKYKEVWKYLDGQAKDLWLDMMAEEEVSQTNLYQHTRYIALKQELTEKLRALGIEESEMLQQSLYEAYKDNYIATGKILNDSMEISWTLINESLAKQTILQAWKGANFSSRIWENKRQLINALDKEIAKSVIAGQDVRKVSKNLMNITGRGYSDCERIIRTETMRALNEGQRQLYKDRGYDTVIWIAEKDERSCTECEKLDRQEFPVGDAPSILHPRCRCTFIPKIK